jgi:hypothetical protein
LEFYTFRSFEIVSNFGFRASSFLFLAPLRPFDFAQDMLLCASQLFSDLHIRLPSSLSSFQKAQIQRTINTNFLLHTIAGKPLGLIRQVLSEHSPVGILIGRNRGLDNFGRHLRVFF